MKAPKIWHKCCYQTILLLSYGLSLIAPNGYANHQPPPQSYDHYQIRQLLAQRQYQQGLPLLQQLAQSGYAPAQVDLARLYLDDVAVKQDPDQAYAWSLLAMANDLNQVHSQSQPIYNQARELIQSRRQGKKLFTQLDQQFGQQAQQQQLYPIIARPGEHLTPQPTPLFTPEPIYPSALTNSNANAWAVVSYEITITGNTEKVTIVDSYPANIIDDHVLAAVKSWRYQTGYDDQGRRRHFPAQYQRFALNASDPQAKLAFAQLSLQYLDQMHDQALAGHAEQLFIYSKLSAFHQQLRQQPTAVDAIATDNVALAWLIAAAINGHPLAQYELALCLASGGSCHTDPAKQRKWLAMAAEQRYFPAMVSLVDAYLVDKSTDHHQQAIVLLEQMIHANYLPAFIQYGYLLVNPQQGVKDTHKAIKLAQLAMTLDNDNPDLLAILGIAYIDLQRGEEAQQFLLKAIKEAEHRLWPIDAYVDILDHYQRTTLGQEHPRPNQNQTFENNL